jgi:hypothetical protein
MTTEGLQPWECVEKRSAFIFLNLGEMRDLWPTGIPPTIGLWTSVALVSAFQAKRVAYYQANVAADPANAKYLAAWIARSRK